MNKIKYLTSSLIFKSITIISVVLALMFVACNSDDPIGDDPYGGGKAPLGIRLLTELPSPSQAFPGDLVIFKASGLERYIHKDSDSYDFDFYISNELAEIVSATDTTITVKVPESLSSGISHMMLDGQVFYGPKLTVLGNVSIDRGYGLRDGIPGTVYNYLEHYDRENHFHFVGDFKFMSPRIHHIARIDGRGNVGGGWSDYYRIDTDTWLGVGTDIKHPAVQDNPEQSIYVKSISYFNDEFIGGRPAVLISGNFTKYQPVSRFQPISVFNITKVAYDMGIQHDDVHLPSILGGGTISTRIAKFNGGTFEPPVETFITSDDNVIAVGNITQYGRIDVENSFAQDLSYEFIPVRTLVKMNNLGELDKEYRQGKSGMAGTIQGAAKDNEDGIFIVGNLETFDDVNVPNIIRVDKEGNLDEEFVANIGKGANGAIIKIVYSEKRKKLMLLGPFTDFNGTPCNGLVMLNEDGNINQSFQLRKMEGGTPNFACILDNHDIVVVSGTFNRYDNVSRQGFLLLDLNGEAIQKFNVPGAFMGELHQVIETKTSTNSNGLLLLGEFYRFDGEPTSSVTMIEVDFD